ELGGARAQGDAQAGGVQDAFRNAPQRGGEVGIEPLGSGEVEIEIVEGGGFDRGGEIVEHAADARGVFGVIFVAAGDEDGVGTDAARVADGHGGAHASGFGLVAGGSDDAAAHEHGPAAEARVEHLLDGGEEGVHVHVDDVG